VPYKFVYKVFVHPWSYFSLPHGDQTYENGVSNQNRMVTCVGCRVITCVG